MTHEGLSKSDAERRLREYGPNALPEQAPVAQWRRFLNQFKSPLIYILLAALGIDFGVWIKEGASGLPVESLAIGLILLLNAGLGVYQESKSEAALAKLKEMASPLVWVMRDGKLQHLSCVEVVPGDVVRFEAGDRVPADGVLLEADGVMIDESILTGESIPLEKGKGAEVFSGTLLARGKGYFEIRRTGEKSAMGRLATMIGGIVADQTPLERRLQKFGVQIAKIVLLLAAGIAVGGLLVEGVERISHVFLFAVALAVAAVPEGLPAVLTLTLSLGVERMAKRKAIVRRLSAVEALGSVTVIATDKTGTLTENRMFVRELDCPDRNRAFRAMLLANDAEEVSGAGDPLELALFDYAHQQGLNAENLQREAPRISSLPFDSEYRFMRVTVREENHEISYLKGAPEVLLERSRLPEEDRSIWLEKSEAYAREGFRLLGLGWREGEGDTDIDFLGLVLLWDPPRPEVPDAIRAAQEAGIGVVMITGDHPATALAVAHEVGIRMPRVLTGVELERMQPAMLDDALKHTSVFARVAPEHKLRLVAGLKANGEITAMTGDGVNDAPALKRSDVGIAMGQRGSDISREVADLVLMDDNFSTIVGAIEEGRNIYENIQKFIRFLFSTNLAEVLIVVMGALGSVMLGLRDEAGALLLPVTAVQLLWINIVTDGPPALALGLDRDASVMRRPPRPPDAPLLDRYSLQFILLTGGMKALVGGALMVFLPQMGFGMLDTRTAIFLHASIGQLFFAYPARRTDAPPQFNPALHLAVILCTVLQLLTVAAPTLRQLLGLAKPDLMLMTIVTAAIFASWGLAETYARIAIFYRRKQSRLPAGPLGIA